MPDNPLPGTDGLIGRTLGGYKIRNRLGGGGMGMVYEAEQLSLGRRVAVKVLRPEMTRDPDFVERFRREARATARLKHPSIVQIYDVGEEEDIYFYSMELVEGTSLSGLLRQHGKMGLQQSLHMVDQICGALEHARQVGIVHRDVKPSNILIESSGQVKLADLGLARAMAGTSTMTATGTILGTPHYISPEQCQTPGEVDTRTDIYSLGVTWFHALAGKPPFDGDTPLQVIAKQCHSPLPSLQQTRPDAPDSLVQIIEKMTRKEVESRYQTPLEVKQAILTCRRSTPTLQMDEAGLEIANASTRLMDAPEMQETSSWKGRAIRWAGAGATAVFAYHYLQRNFSTVHWVVITLIGMFLFARWTLRRIARFIGRLWRKRPGAK